MIEYNLDMSLPACRAQAILAEQQLKTQPRGPVILSLTNVAVSKQKALLHATPATQVHQTSQSAAVSRIRRHALHTLAQDQLHTDSHAQASGRDQASVLHVSSVWVLHLATMDSEPGKMVRQCRYFLSA